MVIGFVKKKRVVSKWGMRSHEGHNWSTFATHGGDRLGGAGTFDPAREEKMVMGLTIIIVIIMLGLVMPLFLIIGTIGSITFFCLNRMGANRKERTVALTPQLGLTMADGGNLVVSAQGKRKHRTHGPDAEA